MNESGVYIQSFIRASRSSFFKLTTDPVVSRFRCGIRLRCCLHVRLHWPFITVHWWSIRACFRHTHTHDIMRAETDRQLFITLINIRYYRNMTTSLHELPRRSKHLPPLIKPDTLPLQQLPLLIQRDALAILRPLPLEPSQGASRRHHAMTRNFRRERIPSQSVADGAW